MSGTKRGRRLVIEEEEVADGRVSPIEDASDSDTAMPSNKRKRASSPTIQWGTFVYSSLDPLPERPEDTAAPIAPLDASTSGEMEEADDTTPIGSSPAPKGSLKTKGKAKGKRGKGKQPVEKKDEERGEQRVAQSVIVEGIYESAVPIRTLRGSNGAALRYCSSVLVDDDRYWVGDCVYVRTADAKGEERAAVAEILSISRPPLCKDWSGNVVVRWLYSPEETEAGRQAGHLPEEVLATSHIDPIDLACLVGPCEVLSWASYMERREALGQERLKDTFVCRYYYDIFTRLTRAYTSRTPVLPKAVDTSVDILSTQSAEEENPLVDIARKALQLASAPPVLPCRSQQRKQIRDFLTKGLTSGGLGSSLYISGAPGTGKTALVMEVVRDLESLSKGKHLPAFSFISINAMKLATAEELYTQLAMDLLDIYLPSKGAASFLDAHFSGRSSRPHAILLVDELDFLVTRNQMVLYNLFNWPLLPHSRLLVVCIANTMDLPERLAPKVSSRLSNSRIVFPPYSKEQLTEIVTDRLGPAASIFDVEAVKFVAAAVSNVNGDVRRLLQILRKALVLAADQRAHGLAHDATHFVTLGNVKKARVALMENITVRALRSCSPWEKLLISSCMVLQQRRSNEVLFSLQEVHDASLSLLSTAGMLTISDSAKETSLSEEPDPFSPAPSIHDLHAAAVQLHRLRICVVEPVKHSLHPNVRVLPTGDEVQTALKDDNIGRKLLVSI
jgi:Cdc6-like AAA superfamily ATPase